MPFIKLTRMDNDGAIVGPCFLDKASIVLMTRRSTPYEWTKIVNTASELLYVKETPEEIISAHES